MKRLSSVAAAVALTFVSATGRAEPVHLEARDRSLSHQPPLAWTIHGAVTAAALIESAVIGLTDPPTTGVLLTKGIDPWARAKYSEGAAGASKGFATLQLLAPVPALATLSSGQDFAHGMFIYGEALSISVGLSRLIDHFVARPRPYTYSPSSPSATPRCQWVERADCRSFYSGRASAAYAAAFAGGYLFQEVMSERYMPTDGYEKAELLDAARKERDQIIGAAWAMQFALAGATAHLQARAGEVFYSDVLVGMLAGSAIGVGTYASYGGSLSLSKWSVGGMLGGTLIGWIPPLWVKPKASEYSVGLLPFDAPGVGLRVVGKL
jgi:hypothetical protein